MPRPFDDSAFWLQRVELNMSTLQLLALHGCLCLALRHPRNTGAARAVQLELVARAGAILRDLGALTADELVEIERGEGLHDQVRAP